MPYWRSTTPPDAPSSPSTLPTCAISHDRRRADDRRRRAFAEVKGAPAPRPGVSDRRRRQAARCSKAFGWFAEHYPHFVYIDRIVIANAYRRHGLGRIFYSDVSSYAEVRVPLLTCEVFLEPRDDVVVLFHGTYGFQEVGQQRMGQDGPQVSLLAKDLPSYTYVRETPGSTTAACPTRPGWRKAAGSRRSPPRNKH
ncbi:MAG: hypothetical protein WDW38_006609 [Sanguina aurantia]